MFADFSEARRRFVAGLRLHFYKVGDFIRTDNETKILVKRTLSDCFLPHLAS